MQATIQSWGNSLAMRIPKQIVKSMKLEAGQPVEYRYENNQLIIQNSAVSLEALLANVSDEQLHTESFFETPYGKELW